MSAAVLRLAAWPVVAVAVAVAGAVTLPGLWETAFGPTAADPHGPHLAAAYAWMGIFGFLCLFTGLATTWVALRRAAPLVAGALVAGVGAPVTLAGTVTLYVFAACLGWV